MLLLAVSGRRDLGVDVETLARPNLLHLADEFFAAIELAALRALPTERQHERFFEYWTLKESYIKATSAGLSMPLQRFAFSLGDAGRVRFAAAEDVDRRPNRWAFLQFRPACGFVAAVCVDGTSAPPREMVLRRVTPLLDAIGDAQVIPFPA